MAPKFKTVHQYLKTISGEKRAALEKLRTTIQEIVPNAEECISYNMPAFRVGDRIVAGFLATAKGCSYYPFSGSTLQTLGEKVKKYSQTKSALHFDPARPLPKALVRQLIRARMAED